MPMNADHQTARARPLTPGETSLATLVFGNSVDYRKVRIHNRCYLPFGLQPSNVAMTPNGSMYFHHSCFLDDFSASSVADKHWFMHEMVHVWQHQLGFPVRLRGAIRLGLSYRYALGPDKTLADFNMEAQGDLLADYFVLKFLQVSAGMRQPQPAASLPLFETVLRRFLSDPRSDANLPWGPLRFFRPNSA
jgi:hypothetical protein